MHPVKIPLGEYLKEFLEKRRNTPLKPHQKAELAKLQDEWLEKAKSMDQSTIDSIIHQLNRETCNSRDAVLEISRDIEELVGDNPLLYAPSTKTFQSQKLFLTELLQKVRN